MAYEDRKEKRSLEARTQVCTDDSIRSSFGELRRKLHNRVAEHVCDYLRENTVLTSLAVTENYIDGEGKRRDLDVDGDFGDVKVAVEIKSGFNSNGVNGQAEAFLEKYNPAVFFYGDYKRLRSNDVVLKQKSLGDEPQVYPSVLGIYMERVISIPPRVYGPIESDISGLVDEAMREGFRDEAA